MKRIYISLLLVLVGVVISVAQPNELVLSSPESGYQLHQALYSITFAPGYSYSGTNFTAEIVAGTLNGDTRTKAFDVGDFNGEFNYTDTQNTSIFTNSYTSGRSTKDVFYKFKLMSTMDVTISHCGSVVGNTYMSLLNSVGTLIVSNDDYSGDGHCSTTLHSYIRRTLDPGIYYVVSEGYSVNGQITTNISGELLIDNSISGTTEYNSTPIDPDSYTIDESLSPVDFSGGLEVNGVLNYTVPIEIPNGVNNLQPQISLDYSSSLGEGLAGIGWNIGGLSEICLVAPTYYNDGITPLNNYYIQYQYEIDGERLIATNESETEFHTEIEGFRRIEAHDIAGNGPKYFKVYTRDGLICEYGNTSDSRILWTGSDIMVWKLNKIEDRNGNVIKFEYFTSEQEYPIKKIEYGSSNNNIATIFFSYKSRGASYRYLKAGNAFNRSILLDKIEIVRAGSYFAKYCLSYTNTANKPLLEKFIRFSSKNEEFNPLVFSYSSQSIELTYRTNYTNGQNQKRRIFQGDFNGDGITDILTLPAKDSEAIDPLGYVWKGKTNGTLIFGWQFTPDPIYSNYIVADLNSDGKTDMLCIVPEVEDFYVYPWLSNGDGFDIDPEVGANGWPIDSVYNFQTVVDYNGDGVLEILAYRDDDMRYKLYDMHGEEILDDAEDVVGEVCEDNYIGSSYHIVDFDGDGCSDILTLNDTGYSLFQFKDPYIDKSGNEQIGELKRTDYATEINNSKNICFGDFNGDGLTDFICSNANSTPGWKFMYHTKYGLAEMAVTGLPTNINMDPNVTRCESADVNGDGKTDLVFYNNQSTIYVGLNKGNGYEYTWHSFPSPVSFDMSTITSSLPSYYNIGDYNGDGFAEFLYTKPGSERCFSFTDGIYSNLLETVVNSLGAKTDIEYLSLTNSSIYTKKSDAVYPVKDQNISFPVVSFISTDNGVGSTNTIDFQYNGTKVHCQGKGFLGFSETLEYSSATGFYIKKYYDVDQNYFYPRLNKITQGGIQSPFAVTTNEWTNIDFGDKRFYAYVSSSSSVNTVTGLTSAVSCLYEKPVSSSQYAVLKEQIKSYGENISVKTEYTYDNELESNWLIGRPTQIKTTAVRGSDTKITQVGRSYITNSNLPDVDVYNAGDAATWTLDRDYDQFGNIWKEKKSTTGLNTQTTEYSFDSTNGVDLTQVVDPQGRITYFAYYTGTGTAKKITDSFGNTTTHYYDSSDQLSSVEPSNGIITTYQYSLNVTGGPTLSRYYVQRSGADGSYSKAWFDLYGREIRSEVKGFSGAVFKADKGYEKRGLLVYSSEPQTTSPSKWSSLQYDVYGRLTTKDPYYGPTSTYVYTAANENTGAITKETVNGRDYTTEVDDAGLVTKRIDPGGSIEYNYFGDGTLESTKVLNSVVTSFTYDKNGNRKTMNDPSAGLLQNTWYGTGQLHTTTNADGELTTYVYLANGLLDYYTEPFALGNQNNRKVDYGYNSDQLVNNITITETGRPTVSRSYTYENGRVKTMTESIESVTNTVTFDYDGKGRLWKKYYNGTTDYEQYNYNSYGYLYSIQFNGATVWQLTSADEYGRSRAATIGSTSATWGYDANNMLSQIKATGVQQYDYSFNANTGNLNSRSNYLKSKSETFGYDSNGLDRLTTVTGPVAQTVGYTTNKNGNILNKTDAGTTYAYDETPYAVSSIENYQNISTTTQQIDYYSFEKVKKITEGTRTADFEYNADNQRIRMVLKNNGTETKTRWYFAGNVEREKIGSTTYDYIWIGGDVYTAVAVAKRTGTGAWTVYNIFRDHLGTITHLKTGSTVTEYSFDAWGRRRDKDDWTYTLTSEPTLFADRGFTAHEYLEDFKLYNMNGRMYDPVVGRFLNPDPVVQAPGFTQSFNRYSYCLNNPLKFTDPSGNFWGLKRFGRWLQKKSDKFGNWLAEHNISFQVGVGMTGGSPYPFAGADLPNGTSVRAGYNTGSGQLFVSATNDGFTNLPNSSAKSERAALDNLQSAGQGYRGDNIDNVAASLAGGWVAGFAEPTLIGEVVMGIATTGAVLYYGPDIAQKMQREIDNIMTKSTIPQGFVYELRATRTGPYPNLNTGGTTMLNKGDVWKYGQTTKGLSRYPDARINLERDGLEMIPIFPGNQVEILIQEKIMIYGYFFEHGRRPPGNPIFR